MAQPSGTRSTAELLARLLGVGWYVGLSIAGGVGGGYWLDGRFDTRPVFALVGLALGILVAFAGMIRVLGAMWNSGPGTPGDGDGPKIDDRKSDNREDGKEG